MGGGKQDHDDEKNAAAVLRGDTGEDESMNLFPSVDYPLNEDGEPCLDPDNEEAEPLGKWIKGLNRRRTCFIYIHTHSREIRGVRPRGYEESDKEIAAAKKREAQIDNYAHMITCGPGEVREVCYAIRDVYKKTPLICSANEAMHLEVLPTLAEEEHIMNTRPFVYGPIRTKIKMPDAIENSRRCMVNAAKAGKCCVVDVAEASPLWLEKIHTEKYRRWFPKEVFGGDDLSWAPPNPNPNWRSLEGMTSHGHPNYLKTLKKMKESLRSQKDSILWWQRMSR